MFELVGRDEELAVVRAFMGDARDEPLALVLEGAAGIGKSTLWDSAVAEWCAAGGRVLSSRPAEAERGLAHVGLGDLFEDVLADVLPALSPPRRRALEVALAARGGGRGRRRSARARDCDAERTGTARGPRAAPPRDRRRAVVRRRVHARARLRAAEARGRLVCACCSPGGAKADARRRSSRRSRRPNVQRVHVGPLSVGALHRLLRDRLGTSFARQTLLRIHERSGGQPVLRARAGARPRREPRPAAAAAVPETLEELVRARITALPAPTREALALASAMGTRRRRRCCSERRRAGDARSGRSPRTSSSATNGTIRFTHPLLSSALYGDLGAERATVHARIAAVVDDPLLRARHLALSKETPDADVAGVLDDAASARRPSAARRPSPPSSPSRRCG